MSSPAAFRCLWLLSMTEDPARFQGFFAVKCLQVLTIRFVLKAEPGLASNASTPAKHLKTRHERTLAADLDP
jgi:hypothetical protein